MAPDAPLAILRREWRWWLAGAVAAILLASVALAGWPQGLVPDLAQPYAYRGDSHSHAWMIERLIEGSLLENPRSGYPFGSSFADYPNADGANLLLLKAFGLASGDFIMAMNAFILSGFGAIFVVSFVALRTHGLARPWACCGAMLFDFAPFHFQRIEHLFYTMYAVVPVFYYLAWRLWQQPAATPARGWRARTWRCAGLLALGSFGVYYAFFGVLVVATAAAAALLRWPRMATLQRALTIICVVSAGVLLNLVPNKLHAHVDGPNPEVAQRLPGEAEIYGFKFVQLLMPRPDHRLRPLADFAFRYHSTTPLANENSYANLGALGAVALLAMMLAGAAALAGRRIEPDIRVLALVLLVLVMFGTIGGFGSLFAQLVSSSLRGWNRISIFIAYGALLGGLLMLQRHARATWAGALALAVFGLADQTSKPSRSRIAAATHAYSADRAFVGAIEAALPPASAVYQLPYMGFPEVAPRERLHAYDHMIGMLHSRTLRWSYAGMKGREGDLFYRALEKEPMQHQLAVLRRLGFGGIYVDRRGYPDQGQAVIAQLRALLGAGPALAHADGDRLYFRLTHSEPALAPGQAPMALMRRAGFLAGPMGKIVDTSLADGIDFTSAQAPPFLKSVRGLSYAEADGRWSDAALAPSVRLVFRDPLPPRFVLELTGMPFGPNLGRELTIRIAGREYRQPMPQARFVLRQPVQLARRADTIDLSAPQPVSPLRLEMGLDARELGVKFVRLRLLPEPVIP